jgi:hypothetical protein
MTHVVPRIAKTVEEGAATSVYLASSPDVADVSGRYFVDCRPVKSSPASYPTDTVARQYRQPWNNRRHVARDVLPALLFAHGGNP